MYNSTPSAGILPFQLMFGHSPYMAELSPLSAFDTDTNMNYAPSWHNCRTWWMLPLPRQGLARSMPLIGIPTSVHSNSENLCAYLYLQHLSGAVVGRGMDDTNLARAHNI